MEQRPQLVILTTAFYPHVGGAEMAVQAILPQLSTHLDCTVVTARLRADLPARDFFAGVPVIRVGIGNPKLDKLLLMFFGWWYVQRVHKKNTPIGVWAIMASYAGMSAFITNRLLKIKYALTLQEGDDLRIVNKRVARVRIIFAQIFKRAVGIQAIASFLAQWAKTFGPLMREPVVIPNGVSVSDFNITPENRKDWRRDVRTKLGIPDSASTIVTVSRLVTKNGVQDLISALTDLPDTHLIIVGDGLLRESLGQAAAAFAGRVHFVGTADRAKILKYAAASDIFCRAALSEGQGIVFLEAMAMGLPVVATKVGGIPETVVSGTGILVLPQQVHELAAALRQIQSDPLLAAQLVAAAQKQVQLFDWSILAPQIDEWITKTVFDV